ncbi:uncharacterized protein LOC122014286 [Zingiber officinale]|uniref:uncharacterized protein LOC122014286 n=1 Tax=Zingiber officinale TaxID=94328 RepID=UPI001C4C07E0|nr:uncharacterized protein LOC122014286 [Zingiber officinale]XP_042426410.1 uncharacterized protein LOC122014286 [Zingiber officinale]
MNQSSRLQRREVSPVEFARPRVFVNPDPLEGQCWFRKDSNIKRAAIDSGCSIVLPAEDSFADEIWKKSSPKKTIEIPKMRLLEEELSKVKETKHPSPPSLIARLMGLDAFPPRKKDMGSDCQITSYPSLLGNYADGENCSPWRNTEKQEFKDVFEVTEAPKSRKHTNHSDTMATHKRRVYEVDASIARKKFVGVKGQSSIELLHDCKEFDCAFEITDSGKDISLEHIQDSKSPFARHLQDLKHTPSSSRSSRIIVLKPYKGSTEHRSNEVQCRPCRTEKGNDRFYHLHSEITGSYMPYATRLKKWHSEQDRRSLPYNPPPSRGRSETGVLPVPIVVLKPIRKKAEKVTKASFLKHDHLWFDSKKDRKIAESRTREFHGERNGQNLFHCNYGLNNKVDGSERIYRNITRKMRHNRNRLAKWNFTSQTGAYAGTRDSLMMPCIAELVHSDTFPQSPDAYGDLVSSFTSSTIKTKSYVAMEPSHYSKRWNVTQQFHDSSYISRCSSTPNEDSEPFEEETTKYTLDFSKNISAKNLSRDEVLFDKICHLGISSKDACRFGSSRFSPSSKSIPDSGMPKLIDRKLVGGKTILGNVPDVESSDSLDAKFCMLIPQVKKSEHQNHSYQFDDSIEDKDMLPECEIHVDSEGLGKKVSKLNTAPTNHSMTGRYCLNDSIYIPIPGDEAWKLITHDQELGSTFQVPSSHTHNHIVIQEKLSSHPRVKFILPESNIAESQLKSNDIEQPSPILVSETLSENETYSSGCFDRLSAELKELRSQLQRLKMESAGTCAEESEVLMLSDEDCAGSNTILLSSGDSHEGFRDDDDRDFTYLLDILVESGIQNINDSKLLNACCLLDCPLDQSVFSKLEKKYDGIAATWSRLERKLLFDLIGCCLADLVSSSMGVCPQLISSTCLPACDCGSLIEGLWQIVAEQKKGPAECSDNKVLEPGLFVWKYNMDLVVIEMEKILNADLLEELVAELQAAWVIMCSSYADPSPI